MLNVSWVWWNLPEQSTCPIQRTKHFLTKYWVKPMFHGAVYKNHLLKWAKENL